MSPDVPIAEVEGVEGLKALMGEVVGPTDWREVTQREIDDFARLSGDDQWIHVDVERAKTESPFGTTIAHGFLTLSLMTQLKIQETFEITGFNFMVNYGSNKLRFVGAVPSGSKIHMRSRVVKVEPGAKGGMELTREFAIHVGGSEKPAVLYEMIVRYM